MGCDGRDASGAVGFICGKHKGRCCLSLKALRSAEMEDRNGISIIGSSVIRKVRRQPRGRAAADTMGADSATLKEHRSLPCPQLPNLTPQGDAGLSVGIRVPGHQQKTLLRPSNKRALLAFAIPKVLRCRGAVYIQKHHFGS